MMPLLAKQIDEQSKQAGFYQEALDFTARKGLPMQGLKRI